MKIALDATEFMDRVEEQLSWLAVADSCVKDHEDARRRKRYRSFFTEHFRCATPWVSLGDGDTAALEFSDGLAAEVGWKPDHSDLSRRDRLRLMQSLLRSLRRPLRDAEVREDGVNADSYLLRSVAMLPATDVVRGGPARGMRRVWFQGIELTATAAPSRRDVLVSSVAIRHDGLDLVGEADAMPASDAVIEHITMAAANQSALEDQWTVELALGRDRTGLAIPTDAVGARDLLASLGRTADRRALVHWVKAHYRRKRGGGDPSLVRAHLRGTQFALAQHLYATVRPSIVDVDTACNGKRFEISQREAS